MIGTMASKALHSPQYIYWYFASSGEAAFSGLKHGYTMVDSQYGQMGGVNLAVLFLSISGMGFTLRQVGYTAIRRGSLASTVYPLAGGF
jgi:hypothetical protein